jgi:hypothetical protein
VELGDVLILLIGLTIRGFATRNLVAILRHRSQAGIDGWQRITKIQGITVDRLASEVI